jgi:hypothetical protein
MADTNPVDGSTRTDFRNGVLVYERFSAALQSWVSSGPGINVQAPTPLSSPPTAVSYPPSTHSLAPYYSSTSSGAEAHVSRWPGRIQAVEPPYTLSARALLDHPLPSLATADRRQGRTSSAANYFYANIVSLKKFSPPNIGGYTDLSNTLQYYPIQPDPTLMGLRVESDAIRAREKYVLDPVNKVLYYNSYSVDGSMCPITTSCEESRVTSPDSNNVTHLSRVDYGWDVLVRGIRVKFAIIEFKRPGALDFSEWVPATKGLGPVEGGGEKSCRQLVKYGYTWNVRYVVLCDWNQMVLLVLEGERTAWFDQNQQVHAISAEYTWITEKDEIKRKLWAFLRVALMAKLIELGLNVL